VRQLDGSENALLENLSNGDPEGLAAAATARDHKVLDDWLDGEKKLRGAEREYLCLQSEMARNALTAQLKLSSLDESRVDPEDPAEARAAASARRAVDVAQSLAELVAEVQDPLEVAAIVMRDLKADWVTGCPT